jgi:phage recombination protein Bet
MSENSTALTSASAHRITDNHKPRTSLVEKMAARFSVEPNKLLDTLKATAFRQQRSDQQVSNEQMCALLVVADQYGLNPFTRELFAFPDKNNGIVPVVSVDGWARIINDHPQLNGISFRYSEEKLKLPGAKSGHEWIECSISRKDRAEPITIREYLDEVYRPPFERDGKTFNGPWQSHTNRLHRHKTLIQCSRIAFGFGGIYDEDEAQRIVDMGAAQVVPEAKTVIQKPSARVDTAAEDVTPATAEAPKIEDGPAGDAALTFVRKQLLQAEITEAELLKKFNLTEMDQIQVSTLNDVLAWIKEPGA